EWDGARWHGTDPPEIATARYQYAAAFDTVRDEVLIFGGSLFSSDTWSWNGSTWSSLVPTAAPEIRLFPEMASDTARHQIILFGGLQVLMPAPPPTTWKWDGTTWSAIATNTPPNRIGHKMAFDPHRGTIVMFGSFSPGLTNELWEFDGTTW